MADVIDNQDESTPKIDDTSKHSVSSATNGGRTFTISIPSFKRRQPSDNGNATRWRAGTMAVLFILVSLISGAFGGWLEAQNTSTGFLGANLSKQEKVVTSQSQLINQIAKTVGPSVVSVNVSITSTTPSTPSYSGAFGLFGLTPVQTPQQQQQIQAAGTGIIISSNGVIMTNRHVVPVGTTSVSVTLSNGVQLNHVKVIGRTPTSSSLDIAFLKVTNLQGQKLVPAVIGNSSNVQVGDAVVAIGNALGQFQNTVTSGIISGYGRNVQASASGSPSSSSTENLTDLFQTDAAINKGNSGGPLVNMNGQVIGINTAIAGHAQNIGFSIPVNDVKGLMEQVLKTGKFVMPYLGIRYIPITSDIASSYNLPVQNGAFIPPSLNASTPSVVPGSPAAKAGLQTNDIITKINGHSVNATHSLSGIIGRYTPGTNVTLTVIRNQKTIKVNVTLGTMP